MSSSNKLDHALFLARNVGPVFPLIPRSKLPAIFDWPVFATRDEKQIVEWWTNGHARGNIGISREGILPVDIDNKEGRQGDKSIALFEMLDKPFPKTFEQTTPTGGRHLIYKYDGVLRNSIGRLAPGIDITGYLVGGGSALKNGVYSYTKNRELAPAPPWLVEALVKLSIPKKLLLPSVEIDEEQAKRRAISYLQSQSGEPQGARTSAVYRLACYLKDLGVSSPPQVCEFIDEYWAPKCSPPLATEEITLPVENAFAYAQNSGPVKAPEAVFNSVEPSPSIVVVEKKLDPVSRLNKNYAFIQIGGGHRILYETPRETHRLNEESFHAKFANQFITTGDGKPQTVSRMWMKAARRRSYEGLIFEPDKPKEHEGYYNLWRGFAVEPRESGSDEAKDSVKMYLEHVFENICDGNEISADWVMAFLADIIQKPSHKNGVALVLKGQKGTGKNVLVDQFGHLLGSHYFMAPTRRFLTGQFNSYLEAKLLVTYNEACWAGDKPTEGTLKSIITEGMVQIERKGQEVITLKNYSRVAILGNEDWIVPATADERRYTVLNVGDKRRQDTDFFGRMVQGLEAGGYEILLHCFLHHDYSKVNLREAPRTTGLLEQKIITLESQPFESWWYLCLGDGEIRDGVWEGAWPAQIECHDLRERLERHCRPHKRPPGAEQLGRSVKKCGLERKRVREEQVLKWVYTIPPLKKARQIFEEYLGQSKEWK